MERRRARKYARCSFASILRRPRCAAMLHVLPTAPTLSGSSPAWPTTSAVRFPRVSPRIVSQLSSPAPAPPPLLLRSPRSRSLERNNIRRTLHSRRGSCLCSSARRAHIFCAPAPTLRRARNGVLLLLAAAPAGPAVSSPPQSLPLLPPPSPPSLPDTSTADCERAREAHHPCPHLTLPPSPAAPSPFPSTRHITPRQEQPQRFHDWPRRLCAFTHFRQRKLVPSHQLLPFRFTGTGLLLPLLLRWHTYTHTHTLRSLAPLFSFSPATPPPPPPSSFSSSSHHQLIHVTRSPPPPHTDTHARRVGRRETRRRVDPPPLRQVAAHAKGPQLLSVISRLL